MRSGHELYAQSECCGECPKIENLLSFYNEHVDLYVDGVLQDRPITPFS
jgi:hypothetical protein